MAIIYFLIWGLFKGIDSSYLYEGVVTSLRPYMMGLIYRRDLLIILNIFKSKHPRVVVKTDLTPQ